MQSRTIALEPATPANFAPYGVLVGAGLAGAGRATSFYADTVRLWSPGRMVSDEDACISVARVARREPRVVWMERHFKHTQAFLPLNAKPFALVVAAPTSDGGLANPDDMRGFRFDGTAGAMLHLGTWHEFPFAVGEPVDLAVLLRNETNRDLDAIEHGEAVGGDLEKRNYSVRYDTEFAVAL